MIEVIIGFEREYKWTMILRRLWSQHNSLAQLPNPNGSLSFWWAGLVGPVWLGPFGPKSLIRAWAWTGQASHLQTYRNFKIPQPSKLKTTSSRFLGFFRFQSSIKRSSYQALFDLLLLYPSSSSLSTASPFSVFGLVPMFYLSFVFESQCIYFFLPGARKEDQVMRKKKLQQYEIFIVISGI